MAPAGRDQGTNRLYKVLGEGDKVEPDLGAGIRGQDPPAANGSKDHDSSALRERLGRQGRRPLKSMFDRRCPQYAELAAQSVEDTVVRRQRTGMR